MDETLLELEQIRRDALTHPAALLDMMRCWDERALVEFGFNMFDPAGPWYWQRDVVDWVQEKKSCIVLKARQIGVTWVGCALAVWTALYHPGALCLLYRQKLEDDAEELVRRCYYQIRSLPKHLLNGARVIRPDKAVLPSKHIWLQFPDGKISKINAQTSADHSGHGQTVSFCLLDEFARIDNAESIMTAVSSAVGSIGTLFIISTANGVSNEETGGGNYFHWLYTHAEEQGLSERFLSWKLHPDRGEDFLEKNPEVRRLKPWKRAEQYPDNPTEAFALSEASYFDQEAMHEYGERTRRPIYRGEFLLETPRKARLVKKDSGWLSVWEEPREGGKYAVGVDTAGGQGMDYSCAYVIDLDEMNLVAEFHGKLSTDLYAEQLYFLGHWYRGPDNRPAILAIESAGGWGEAVIVGLRDGRDGRPPYGNLYHHRQFLRDDQLRHKAIGFPMQSKTRPQVLSHMEEVVRERALPHMPERLLYEMGTFLRYNPNKPDAGGTWPRACPDGLNDDRVIACALALEMYRQRGEYPERRRMKSFNLLAV